MFCVSMKPWLHSNTRIWAPFSWTQRMLEVQVWEQSGTLVKDQGYHALDIRLWGEKGLPKGLGASGPKGLEPIYYSILFYSILTRLLFVMYTKINSDTSPKQRYHNRVTGAYIPLGYTCVSFGLVTNAQHNMGKTNECRH
jgi:hypothetical protein